MFFTNNTPLQGPGTLGSSWTAAAAVSTACTCPLNRVLIAHLGTYEAAFILSLTFGDLVWSEFNDGTSLGETQWEPLPSSHCSFSGRIHRLSSAPVSEQVPIGSDKTLTMCSATLLSVMVHACPGLPRLPRPKDWYWDAKDTPPFPDCTCTW